MHVELVGIFWFTIVMAAMLFVAFLITFMARSQKFSPLNETKKPLLPRLYTPELNSIARRLARRIRCDYRIDITSDEVAETLTLLANDTGHKSDASKLGQYWLNGDMPMCCLVDEMSALLSVQETNQ